MIATACNLILKISPSRSDCKSIKLIFNSYGDSEARTGDDSISEFQLFRYDIDTILTKYRDIDTTSIFCKRVRYTSARTVTRHEQGSMVYLDNKDVCFLFY